MNHPTKWFERKFEFNYSLEAFPSLCMRLRGLPPRIEELLNGQPRETLIHKSGDRWSIQEQAGHLLDLETLWSTRIDDFLGDATELTVADLRNQKTHNAKHNDRKLSEILAPLRSTRLAIVDRIEHLGPETLSRTLPHPRLRQPMRLLDHLYFMAEHDDHHLASIWALLNGNRTRL